MSTGSLIVLAVIALIIAVAILHLVSNWRKGKSGCGCTKCNRCSGPNVDIEDCCRKDDRKQACASPAGCDLCQTFPPATARLVSESVPPPCFATGLGFRRSPERPALRCPQLY